MIQRIQPNRKDRRRGVSLCRQRRTKHIPLQLESLEARVLMSADPLLLTSIDASIDSQAAILMEPQPSSETQRPVTDPVEVIVDNRDAQGFSLTGRWRESGSVDEFQGSSFFNLNVGATATWTPTLEAGEYEVAVRWGAQRSNSTAFPRDPAAQYTVAHGGQSDTVVVDQNSTSGQWVVLDTFVFDGSGQEFVTLTSSTNGSSPANADAVRFTLVGSPPAGISVTPTDGLETTEAGGIDSFEVVLKRQPEFDVTIPVASDDTTEGELSIEEILFTPDNWDTPQTVEITGVDDGEEDGDVNYTIVLGTAVSDDSDYSGLDAVDVLVTNSDNDRIVAEVIVDNQDAQGFTTTGRWRESGSTDEFQGSSIFNLNIGATATWTPTLEAGTYEVAVRWGAQRSDGTAFPRDPLAQYTVAHDGQSNSVEIDQNSTSGEWVVLDTFVFDGSGQEFVTLTSSTNGSSPANADAVRFTLVGAPPAGISVAPTDGLETTETGGADTFEVVLIRQPTSDVMIPIVSSDTTEGDLSIDEILFTPDNWDTPQTLTVTGVDDDEADGDVIYTIVLGAAVSDDTGYSGLDAADVLVTNEDDDVPAGVLVTPSSGLSTTESGGSDSFEVVLTSQPQFDVTIPITSDDTTEGELSIEEILFTPDNWDTPQSVTVTGVDDDEVDGDVDYTIVLGAAVSDDTGYSGLDAADVSVTNEDDDVPAGVLVTPSSGLSTTESGGSDSFEVVLASQPQFDVTIPITSDDTTEGELSIEEILFTPDNWDTPQSVTVTGVDDDEVDGDVDYAIVLGAAVSEDGGYNGLDAIDALVTNADDDLSVVEVIVDNQDAQEFATTGQWRESGSTDEFRGSSIFNSSVGATATWTPTLEAGTYEVAVRWGAQRADGTSFPRDPSAQYTIAHGGQNDTLVIDQNSTSGQWVVLDTFVFDGTGQEFVRLTSSTDGSSPANADAVRLTLVGEAPAGVRVRPVSGLTTTEGGGADSFEVVLTRQPESDVTIPIASDDTTEGVVSTNELVFTPDNWNTSQTVTVTGVDDDEVDDDVNYTIVLGAAISDDSNYNGIDASDVVVTNNDDDGVPPSGEFNIEVRFPDDSLSAAAQALFLDAAARWEEIIVGDLPDANTDIGLVDDLVIDAIARPIDGRGSTLAFAGPTRTRSGSSLASRGRMTFDTADVPAQVSNGSLVNTILHEMGHVLGIGTIWSRLGLIQGDTFIGANAQVEYGALLGQGPTPVPIQSGGGGHWDEPVFDRELMTPILDFGANPISRVTVAALADLGYEVNIDAADSFSLPNRLTQGFSLVDIDDDDSALPSLKRRPRRASILKAMSVL